MPDGPRYDDDFYAWTQYQAEVLRSMECEGNGFDRGNVAEEIEALGRSQLHDAFGLVRKTLTSLLLIAHGPAGRRRYGWMYEIAGWRAELEDKMSPTIWLLTQAELPELYEDARKITELRLRELGADEAVNDVPTRSPYSLDEISHPEPAGEKK